MALGTLLLLHLDQVGCHAEGLVANLILVVFPNTVERGVWRGVRVKVLSQDKESLGLLASSTPGW